MGQLSFALDQTSADWVAAAIRESEAILADPKSSQFARTDATARLLKVRSGIDDRIMDLIQETVHNLDQAISPWPASMNVPLPALAGV